MTPAKTATPLPKSGRKTKAGAENGGTNGHAQPNINHQPPATNAMSEAEVQEERVLQAATERLNDPDDAPCHGVIRIRGARQNNLKNISLDIPRDKLVVITGLSGSGKSSLAFDTLYAEGQRRYVESLSSYARQFLGLHDKPDVDQIDGLSPAVTIDQKSTSKNPRSTVGTVTEIYDYLRLLYARVGVPHDPKTGLPLTKQNIESMVDRILELPVGTRFLILSPVIRGRKGEYRKEMEDILKEGYVRARVDGEMVDLSEEIPDLERYKQHTIEIVIDRLVMKEDISRTRITDALEQALKRAKGVATVDVHALGDHPAQELHFTENYASEDSDFNYDEIEPRLFSFNSPYGACPDCHGLGTKTEFDPALDYSRQEFEHRAGRSSLFRVQIRQGDHGGSPDGHVSGGGQEAGLHH